MDSSNKLRSGLAEFLFAVTVALTALLPVNPNNMKIPNRDAGVFLYVGWQILQGALPYRDIWDHKPPIIFYLNSLGLALAGNSRWGVWGLEISFLFLAVWVGYQLLKKRFGVFPAIFGSLLWSIGFVHVMDGGDRVEEFALPFQFLCMWILGLGDRQRLSHFHCYLIGVLSGIAFFTKQNTIGIGVAIGIWLMAEGVLFKELRRSLYKLCFVALGGLTITAMILGFFYTQRLLPDFWKAAFLYNFFYTNTPVQDKLNELILGFKELSAAGFLEIGAIGWVLCLILVATKKTKLAFLPLAVVALIDFPLELLLASISGRNFPHYYLTLLPILCFLAGAAYWALSQSFASSKIYPYRTWIFLLVTLALLATQATSYMGMWGYFKEYGSRPRYLNTLAYIENHPISNRCDYVLVWGNEAIINFMTQKKSPDRYVYQYPLYMPGYTNEQIIMDFINDVIERKPCYIVNSKNPYTPFLNFPVESAKIRSGVRTIENMYELKKEFGGFAIYIYNGN